MWTLENEVKMAKSDSHKPLEEEGRQHKKLPSTKEIMMSYVNDNVPGYGYWFTRILVFSIVFYIFFELSKLWF
jgi:hypothetical protein